MYLLDAFLSIYLILMVFKSFFVSTTRSLRKLLAFALSGGLVYIFLNYSPVNKVFENIFKIIDKNLISNLTKNKIITDQMYRGLAAYTIPALVTILLLVIFYVIIYNLLSLILKEKSLESSLLKKPFYINLLINIISHLAIGLAVSYLIVCTAVALSPSLGLHTDVLGLVYKQFVDNKVYNILIESIDKIAGYIPSDWLSIVELGI